jgi:hypothetical protein
MEKETQAFIKKFLEDTGWFVYKNNLSGVHVHGALCKSSARGLADLTAIKNGRVLQIEIKDGKGKQSEEQERFEEIWRSHGGEYVVVWSVQDLVEYLSK